MISPQRRKGRREGVSFPWPGDSGQGKTLALRARVSLVPRSTRILGKFVHYSYNALSHNRDIEIQEQAQIKSRQPEVRQHLRFMDRLDGIARFQLEDDGILNDQVQPVSAVKSFALID